MNGPARPARDLRAVIAMMQKDEGALLKTWASYHADIVGGSNLYIVDNGSTDEATLEALEFCRDLGADIRSMPDPRHFEQKGEIITSIMNEHAGTFDWFFPFDCDEFLITIDGQALAADTAHVQEALRQAEASGKPLIRIDRTLTNVPHTTLCTPGRINRAAIKSGFKTQLNLGFHFYEKGKYGVDDDKFVSTSLAFIHFHSRPRREMLRRSRLKLRQRVPDFSKETLSRYEGKGYHLRYAFLVSDEKYIENQQKRAEEGIDCRALFLEKGLPVPFSEPYTPLDDDEKKTLLDPINTFYEAQGIRAELCEVELLYSYLREARSYLEYGTGGTTQLACKAGVARVVSVDPNLDVIEETTKKYDLQTHIRNRNLEFRHAFVALGERQAAHIVNPLSEWLIEYLKATQDPNDHDVVFIDGLFRVSCAAAVYLNQRDPIVLIHDYDRPYYHELERIFDRVDGAGSLVAFRKKPGKADVADLLLRRYFFDSR